MFRKKAKPQWMTRNQLQVLEKIANAGRAGIKIWYTDLNLATIRSLCKRGFADTAKGGRILVTRAGKSRLRQPWPSESAQNDRKHDTGSDGEDGDENKAQRPAGAA